MKKGLLITLGFLSFGLGSIGVILPILPTTPFLLLSAYCFASGSKLFDVWLKKTTLYKIYVADYIETGIIPFKRKWKIVVNIYLLMGISIYFVSIQMVKILLIILTMFITSFLFFVIPSEKTKD